VRAGICGTGATAGAPGVNAPHGDPEGANPAGGSAGGVGLMKRGPHGLLTGFTGNVAPGGCGEMNRGAHGVGCGEIGNCGPVSGLANWGDHGELPLTGAGSDAKFDEPLNGELNGDDELFGAAAVEGVDGVDADGAELLITGGLKLVIAACCGKVLGLSGLNGVRVPGKKFVRFRKKFVRFKKILVLKMGLVAPGGTGTNGPEFVLGLKKFVSVITEDAPEAAPALA